MIDLVSAVGGAVVGALLGWWARRYGGKPPRRCFASVAHRGAGTYTTYSECGKVVRRCVSGYCKVHCGEQLCECLREQRQLGAEEREILEEVRAVTR